MSNVKGGFHEAERIGTLWMLDAALEDLFKNKGKIMSTERYKGSYCSTISTAIVLDLGSGHVRHM